MDIPVIGAPITGNIAFDTPRSHDHKLAKADEMQLTSRSMAESAMYAVPGTVLAAADTFLETFGVVDEEEMENYLKANFPGFGDFFKDNRSTLGMVGDLGAAFIPGMLGVKAVRQGGLLAQAATKTLGPGAAKFFSTGASNSKLFEGAFQKLRHFEQKGFGVNNLLRMPGWKEGRRKLIQRSMGDVLIEGLAADAAIAATMNESDFLFPEEMSFVDHLAFFAGTNAVMAGAAGLIARRTFTRGAQNAIAETRKIHGRTGGLPISEVVANVNGERGLSIGMHSQLLKAQRDTLADAITSGDDFTRQAMLAEITGTQERLAGLTERAFLDSPIPGVTHSTRLSDNTAAPQIKTMSAAYEKDPMLGYNLRSLENFSGDDAITLEANMHNALNTLEAEIRVDTTELNGVIKELKNYGAARPPKRLVEKHRRLLSKIDNQQTKLQDWQSTVPVAVEIDGTTRGLTGRQPMFQDGARRIVSNNDGSSRAVFDELEVAVNPDGSVFISPPAKDIQFEFIDGQFVDPKGTAQRLDAGTWNDLNYTQKTAVWDVTQKSIERFSPETHMDALRDKWVYTPRENLEMKHFTEIDHLLQLSKNPDLNIQIPQFSQDELMFASLSGKFAEFQSIMDEAGRAIKAGKPSIYEGRAGMENIARVLNLPTDNHAMLRFFQTQMLDGELVRLDTVVKNMDELRDALKHIDEFADADSVTHQLIGNMLEMPRDRQPVIAMMANNNNRAGLQTQDLLAAVANQRAAQAATLRSNPKSVFVGKLMEMIDAHAPVVQDAKRMLQNMVHGNEAEGFITKNLVQQTHRFRHDPAFQGFDLLTDILDKANDNMIERVLNPTKFGVVGAKNHRAAFTAILDKSAEPDLDALMVARHALGAGWDVADGSPWVRVAGKEGEDLWQISLKDSVHNRQIFQRMFPGEDIANFTSNGKMLLPTTGEAGKAVTVTGKARSVIESFEQLSDQLLEEVNTLRRARNMPPISRRALHMPSRDLSAKHQVFLVDKRGKFRTVVGGNTENEALALAEKEIAATNGELALVTRDSMERYYAARAESFFAMGDYSKSAKQTGAREGKSFGEVVARGPTAFHEMLESMLRQYSDVGRETRMLVFDPELQYLKLQRAGTGIAKDQRTIYDELVSRIAGVQNLDTNSVLGKGLTYAETTYDRLLQGVYDKLGDSFIAKGAGGARARARYEKLEERFLPEHRPFANLDDYLARTHNVALPSTLRRHAAALNEITTALTIRMFDVGMAVVNVVSLAATLPPTVAMLKKLPDETVDGWTRRIAAFGAVTPNGNGYFSAAKATTDAAHFYFSPEGRAVARRAADLGYFDQFAAEQVEIFQRTGEQFVPGLLRHFSNKVSMLTDSTERLSRGLSFMTFYRVGSKGLGLSDDAAMAFAHTQANRTIADFRPSNRPAIFQGAAGMPLGLFTTFMWNYMQRILQIVELGKPGARAAAIQFGLQGSLFGAESLPGWEEFTGHFMDNYDGTFNVVDRLNETMGPLGADVFLNGTVANLPRLFGADEGISIGPRAAVGLPFQQGFSAQSIAGVRLITRTAETMGKLIDSAIENQGIDPTQSAEIIAASNINKGVSHLIELGVGHSLDHTGSMIEKDTRTSIGIASRAIGFKPLFADELRQENVRNRSTERIQSQLKARLADSLRSDVRNKSLTSERVEDALGSYVKAGGNPESFRRFFQSQVLRGGTSKVDLEVQAALRRSHDENRLARLLYLNRD